jgi:hypothetical protein
LVLGRLGAPAVASPDLIIYNSDGFFEYCFYTEIAAGSAIHVNGFVLGPWYPVDIGLD